MIAGIKFDAAGPPLLLRDDGWQYPLAGIYGMDWRTEGDYRWAGYYTTQCVVTIPPLTVNNIDAVQTSLRVLREELPEDCELVVETT